MLREGKLHCSGGLWPPVFRWFQERPALI